jgi:ribonuclease Z
MSPSTVVSQEIASIQIPLPNATITDSSKEANASRKIKPPKSWTYQGYSRAGTATSFVLVEPKWIFDCGCVLSCHVPFRPTCIFITHTHADHIQTLHQILFSQKPTTIPSMETSTVNTINANTIHVYFPAAAESHLRNFLQSYYELIRDTTTYTSNGNDDDHANKETQLVEDINVVSTTTMEQAYNFQLHPVQVNDEFNVTAASNVTNPDVEYIVRIVQCCHRKICIGYSIFQRQRTWIEPFRSMTGIELGNYVKANLKNCDGNSYNKNNISNMKEWSPVLQPILCFLGDTTTQVYTLHPEILQQHRYIAMECTYYYGTIDDERTNIHQHTFWEVLRTNVLQQHPNILFLLQHFSLRHRQREWMNWMYDYNQSSGFYNVHPMLIQPSAQSYPVSINNKISSYTSDATEDFSDIVPFQALSVHLESSSDQMVSTPVILSCNCFLCQPK